MSLMGIQAAKSAYCPAVGNSHSTRAYKASTYEVGQDKVTISEEAKTKAQEMQAQNTGTSKTGEEEDYPLEAYSVPKWFGDVYGGYTEVATELGIGWEEGLTGYQKLNSSDQRLYDEYACIVDTYWREEMDKAGYFGDRGNYYHNFVQNPANQKEVCESFYQRLENDPRAQELMSYFNIDFNALKDQYLS